jgi:transposase
MMIVSTKRKWTLSKMLVGDGRVRSEGKARRRRRLWSAEEKQQILAEAFEPGASVAAVARRHDLNANMVFTWHRQLGAAAAPAGAMTLVPARITEVAQAAAPTGPSCRIEIVLSSGHRLIVGADVDTDALARVIKVLARR